MGIARHPLGVRAPQTGGVVVAPSPAVGPSLATTLPMEAAITRWSFYLYVAWIPLEYPERTLPFDLGTLLGALFLATTVFSVRACYRSLPWPMVLYGIYLYVWVLSYAVNGGQYAPLVREGFLRLLLLVLVFWASSNLLRNPRTARTTLLILVASCTLLALLQVTGAADAYGYEFEEGPQRATVLGQNPNRTGRFLAAAGLAVVALAFSSGTRGRWLRPAALALIALYAVAMVDGGSRGAMLAFIAGMVPFALVAPSMHIRVRNAVIALLAICGLVWAALQSPLMQERLAEAESGNLAKREEIFPEAIRMIRERPLIGWGPERTYYELGARLARRDIERRDTHNLVLELLATTGIAGAIPALAAIALCLRSAWVSRRGVFGALSLAFMVQMLVANMSGNFLAFKLYWFVQAFSVATASMSPVATPTPRKRRF